MGVYKGMEKEMEAILHYSCGAGFRADIGTLTTKMFNIPLVVYCHILGCVILEGEWEV